MFITCCNEWWKFVIKIHKISSLFARDSVEVTPQVMKHSLADFIEWKQFHMGKKQQRDYRQPLICPWGNVDAWSTCSWSFRCSSCLLLLSCSSHDQETTIQTKAGNSSDAHRRRTADSAQTFCFLRFEVKVNSEVARAGNTREKFILRHFYWIGPYGTANTMTISVS